MESLAPRIEHTILRSETTLEDVDWICGEAVEFGFFGVCVPPCYVRQARERLAGTNVNIVTVVGFPLGNTSSWAKREETLVAIDAGAVEIDMVMNMGFFKSGRYEAVIRDIETVVHAAKEAPVKVIIETGLWSNDQIQEAAKLCVRAGAAFVKTSTGFGPGGAAVEHVRLIREAVGQTAKIKASGGIKNAEFARLLVAAGADRIGTSVGPRLLLGSQ